MVGRPGSLDVSGASKAPSVLGPSQCGSRDRAEDAADAIRRMTKLVNGMDPTVIGRLVHAREAAAGVYKAFPEGDRRFDSVESESEGEEEEVEEEVGEGGNGEEGGAEGCRGLLDQNMDESPEACLKRAKEEYGFDIVAEMDEAKLDFFERIRLVNHLRKEIDIGTTATNVVNHIRSILKHKDRCVLEEDKLLEPVIEGDLILTVLEREEDWLDAGKDDTDHVIDAVRDSLRATHVLP